MRKIQIDYYHHATCTKSRTKGFVDHPHTHSIQAEFKHSRTVKRLEINGKYETKKNCDFLTAGPLRCITFRILNHDPNTNYPCRVHWCQCVFFCLDSLSIWNALHCYVLGKWRYFNWTQDVNGKKCQLQNVSPAKQSKSCRNGKKYHYIHKQVKCMLWLLYYASIAAWYCFNVSVDLSGNSASFSVLSLRLLWARVVYGS